MRAAHFFQLSTPPSVDSWRRCGPPLWVGCPLWLSPPVVKVENAVKDLIEMVERVQRGLDALGESDEDIKNKLRGLGYIS